MQFNILHLYRLRDRAQMERGVIRVYITKPCLHIVSESARRWGQSLLKGADVRSKAFIGAAASPEKRGRGP